MELGYQENKYLFDKLLLVRGCSWDYGHQLLLARAAHDRKRLERASQKQSSDTNKTPYDRAKRCRERKKSSRRPSASTWREAQRIKHVSARDCVVVFHIVDAACSLRLCTRRGSGNTIPHALSGSSPSTYIPLISVAIIALAARLGSTTNHAVILPAQQHWPDVGYFKCALLGVINETPRRQTSLCYPPVYGTGGHRHSPSCRDMSLYGALTVCRTMRRSSQLVVHRGGPVPSRQTNRRENDQPHEDSRAAVEASLFQSPKNSLRERAPELAVPTTTMLRHMKKYLGLKSFRPKAAVCVLSDTDMNKLLSTCARLLEVFSTPGAGLLVRGGGGGIPERIRRTTVSSSTILTCENPVTRPGIEPGSPWWEMSMLTAQPPRPPCTLIGHLSTMFARWLSPRYNLVGPPLAAITAATLSGMLYTSVCRTSTGIRRHSPCNHSMS
ncbi:hypothetical protein PR048_024998 [Dryococelus australis]|uniref:Uncharacterized protein n=1 Tax=Dryococelus australis TaxID=614101 RepID=A0ABQ9GQ41_9NEOP|nr:hypothetical protein PR048_024998 [Dryococelus australis]